MKTLIYKTNLLNPDTDLDGQNDYNDPVPLDYDMDGDRKINFAQLVNPASGYYTERLVVPANNDPNLQKNPDGSFVEDTDVDNDSVNNFNDTDLDADGMPDLYETKYGCCKDSAMYDPGTEVVYNDVQGQGWQNPFIYNARYAVVIVGASDIACENDLLEMYDKLSEYNYLDENIHCLLWDRPNGYKDGRVDGEITQENIINAFSQIGSKITMNDFFYLSEISHGHGDMAYSDGVFNLYGGGWCSFGPMQDLNLRGLLDAYIASYARSVFVMSSCGCNYAINQLYGENRIIITASEPEDWDSEKGIGAVWHQADDDTHWAFLHKGCHYHWYGNNYYPGFIPSLWGHWDWSTFQWIDEPNSIKYAFEEGYSAATNNYGKDPVSFEEVPYVSHPQLDANGNGIPGENADMSIAEYTYL